MFEAFSIDVLKQLDVQKKGYLEWADFKNFMNVTMEMQEKIREFVLLCG